MDVLTFVEQYQVTLEMALEGENLEEIVQGCATYESGTSEIHKCEVFYRHRHARMVQCQVHSARLCRLEGGFC